MNKLLIASMIFIFSAGIFADTDIQFRGVLISDPCLVATDSVDQTVDFDTVTAKTFINHKRSAPKYFRFHLIDCDLSLGTTVSLKFMGTEDIQQPATFAVTGGAEGVAIAIEDSRGFAVPPNAELDAVNLNSGDTWLDYVAYVQSPDYSKIQEGAFESQIILFLEYE